MYKIQNINFAGKTVGISTEDVVFDKNGIGEISSEALYNEIITFPSFSAYTDPEYIDTTTPAVNNVEEKPPVVGSESNISVDAPVITIPNKPQTNITKGTKSKSK